MLRKSLNRGVPVYVLMIKGPVYITVIFINIMLGIKHERYGFYIAKYSTVVHGRKMRKLRGK